IASAFGIEVEGEASRRSISRIVKEGGNASKLQIVESLKNAKGVTISGDGTTHKNETYETKHAAVIDESNSKLQFFLGLKMATNHTSEEQLDGWIETVEDLFHLSFESGLCTKDDARIFWNLVTGFHSDHAADQKKLFHLLKEWKKKSDRDVRGENAVSRLNDLEYASLVVQGALALVQNEGSLAWEALPLEEQNRKIEGMKKQLVRDIGEAEFNKLSDAEKAEVDFFLWAGCCMHKEMNAFKGGCIGLDSFWKEHPHLTPPLQLPNRDNAATIKQAQGTEAAEHAIARTERGAVKVASLAGAVFRHKDRKRGQQDTLRFFFDSKLGFVISFPDTSNTRFQSHAEACAVMITYLDLFIEFLTYVKENKGSGMLNHMEQNVFNGLQDIPTRHEICTITLYWLAISIPYMREIRGIHAKEDNILRLGEFHHRLIAFINELIAEPERLVGPNASYKKGSFDGLPWGRPESFYAVQQQAPHLPHLQDTLVYFLKQSRIHWVRFGADVMDNPALDHATEEQIDRAWMEKTNDLNEADFGTFRQTSKQSPTISIPQYNARKMFKFNDTSAFLHSLSPDLRRWLRKVTRSQDASGSNHQEKIQLAHYRENVAEERI
ncbi:hypothetical protein DFJ43DRAFT_989255, partial [Lentinula guzmanii]